LLFFGLGEVISWYMESLKGNIENLVRDDMGKEAFAEAVSKRVIQFVFLKATDLKKGESFYVRSKITDGKLIIEIPIKELGTAVSDAGKDIEKLL